MYKKYMILLSSFSIPTSYNETEQSFSYIYIGHSGIIIQHCKLVKYAACIQMVYFVRNAVLLRTVNDCSLCNFTGAIYVPVRYFT